MFDVPFDAHTTGFSLRTACGLARAAKLAYAGEAEVTQKMNAAGFSQVAFFDEDDTQGFLAADDDKIIVSFRGTEGNFRDWLTDLKIRQIGGPGGDVHRGFNMGLDAVWKDLHAMIEELRPTTPRVSFLDAARGNVPRGGRPPRSLWFTGHSLGAALATVATARLKVDEDRAVDGLYTFGSPRVGDGTFARTLNAQFGQRIFRFVNNNDIVTRVAPRALRYSHTTGLRYFDEDGDLHTDISWWNRFLDRVDGHIKDFSDLGPDGVKDHFMDGYVALVEKALERERN